MTNHPDHHIIHFVFISIDILIVLLGLFVVFKMMFWKNIKIKYFLYYIPKPPDGFKLVKDLSYIIQEDDLVRYAHWTDKKRIVPIKEHYAIKFLIGKNVGYFKEWLAPSIGDVFAKQPRFPVTRLILSAIKILDKSINLYYNK
jgi:hypothetical protein